MPLPFLYMFHYDTNNNMNVAMGKVINSTVTKTIKIKLRLHYTSGFIDEYMLQLCNLEINKITPKANVLIKKKIHLHR